MGAVRVTSRVNQWAATEEARIDRRVLEIATDIDRASAVLAPKLTGALVKSKRINRKGIGHYTISYGSGSVRYARKRHFENKKNPGTLRYLERGGDSVKRNIGKYFR
jgi:hypothetical protein